MTDDLISRADAIKALGEEPLVWCDFESEFATHAQWERDIDALKSMPSAQPKQGEWVNHEEPCVNGGYWHYVMCTACKELNITPTNYCPNCGARMTERSE